MGWSWNGRGGEASWIEKWEQTETISKQEINSFRLDKQTPIFLEQSQVEIKTDSHLSISWLDFSNFLDNMRLELEKLETCL